MRKKSHYDHRKEKDFEKTLKFCVLLGRGGLHLSNIHSNFNTNNSKKSRLKWLLWVMWQSGARDREEICKNVICNMYKVKRKAPKPTAKFPQ